MRLAWIAVAALCLASASAQTISLSQNQIGYDAIYQASPNAQITGDTVEHNMATVRVPANTMGPNGSLRIAALYTYPNSANVKTMPIRFSTVAGGTAGTALSSATATTTVAAQLLLLTRANAATNSQLTYGSPLAPFGTTGNVTVVSSLDTTQDTFVNFNGQLALGTETLTLVGYTVEVIHP